MMKLHYQDLFNIIVRYNHKNLEFRQKQSLSAIINMFSNEIYYRICHDIKMTAMVLPLA
jgi:hypothetical protein